MGSKAFATRYSNRDEARRLFSTVADEYASHYHTGDPLGEALAIWMAKNGERAEALFDQALNRGLSSLSDPPQAIQQFFQSVESTPEWLDHDETNLGAISYQRTGVAGMLVLSAWSLLNGYYSAPAVKPLVFTGALETHAPQRLASTSRYVSDTTQRNAMRRFSKGFKINVRVRLVHARIRTALVNHPDWDTQAWGLPINQADMLGTLLEFSILLIEGARKLGIHFSNREANAVLQLWRYAGHIGGVDPSLLRHLKSEQDAHRIAELIKLVQPGPDDDSRRLAAALLSSITDGARTDAEKKRAAIVSKLHHGLARALNGSEIADALNVPDDSWQYVVYPIRAIVGSIESVRRRIPGANHALAYVNNRFIRADIDRMTRGMKSGY